MADRLRVYDTYLESKILLVTRGSTTVFEASSVTLPQTAVASVHLVLPAGGTSGGI